MSFSIEENTSAVEIRELGGAYVLCRNGKPFFVKGACGFENLERLAECGANSVRTWGSDQTMPILPDIRRLGLTLCAGLWMEPPRRGFDYGDPAAVREQEERLLEEVAILAREPNLLLWGVGNELDLENDDPVVWDAVERLARAIKERDPAHPVITVISSPRLATLRAIERRCPSLDALGVNSYADMPKVAPALDAAGWDRPYLVTEWGSDGSWEVPKTPWGAPLEPSSFRKAMQMRHRYRIIQSDTRRCIGSYAFFWGNKQETTPTWFNLFDSDGCEYEGVEALRGLWNGSAEGTALAYEPRVDGIALNGVREHARVEAGSGIVATVETSSDAVGRWDIRWSVMPESRERHLGGDPETDLSAIPVSFEGAESGVARFRAPAMAGPYRLYVYATDPEGRRASANIPFLVT